MLSIVKINSVDYYDKLSKELDYYDSQESGSGEPKGTWGKGIEALGIKAGSQVGSEELRAIMSGFDHRDGSKLVQSAGQDDHRLGMDLTFSAPKSLSILWANASPELQAQISQIQSAAVDRSMSYLRDQITTRRGKDGERKEAVKELLFAKFEHSNSRENDPQLHTHAVVSNTVVRLDGTTGTMTNDNLYNFKMTAGALYRSELAQSLRALGFQTEQDPKNEGMFRIAGFDEKLEKHFSKRSEQIKGKADELGIDSAQGKNKIALSTRAKKAEVDRAKNFEEWQAQSKAQFNFDQKAIEALKDTPAPAYQLPTTFEIVEKLTEHENTFSKKDLDRFLFEQMQYTDFDVSAKRQEILSSSEVVKVAKRDDHQFFTSKNLVEIEQGIIAKAQAAQSNNTHNLDSETVTNAITNTEKAEGYTLRVEQKNAIHHLTSGGALSLLVGKAGAGKTTSLKTVASVYQDQGFEVLGMAISAKAASVLGRETGIDQCDTIARFLIDLENGKADLTDKSIIVIDEFGMCGSRDFAKIQEAAQAAGAKIIGVGDPQQLQAISAGGIMSALIHQGQVPTATLETITRQKSEIDRQASTLFSQGRTDEALQIYEAQGNIVSKEYRAELFNNIASDYLSDQSDFSKKMIITATKAEASAISKVVREALKDQGKIDDRTAVLFENADREILELCEGDRVLFKQNAKALGLKNNEQGTVLHTEQNGDEVRLKIELDGGEIREIDSSEYNNIRSGFAVTGHSSQGETVQNSYVLFNSGISDFSWSYVGLTRHKEHTKLYTTLEDRENLGAKFAEQHFKNTTFDLDIEPSQPTFEAAPVLEAAAEMGGFEFAE